jgi:hypothetical protein
VAGAGGMDVIGALRGQTLLSLAAALAAYFMGDQALLALIPDLTPFQALSPAIGLIVRVIEALARLTRGQTWRAWDDFGALHQELSGPASEALDPLMRFTLRGLVLGYLSALSADHASAGAETLIDAYARFTPDHAEGQRTRLCLMRGDLNAAANSRRRFELLSVRLGSMSDARLFDLAAQVTLYALCDDSTGLRRTLQVLQHVARTRSGWRPRSILAEAQLLRCQGNVPEGLRLIESLMAELPHACLDYGHAAATHLELLNAAQRWREAAGCGRAYVQQLERAQSPEYRVELALCQACAAVGEHEEAQKYFEHARAQLEAREVTGVLSGVTHEIGARIALRSGDQARARALLVRCEKEFRFGKHPALAARFHALQRDLALITRAGVLPAAISGRPAGASQAPPAALDDASPTETDTQSDRAQGD